jgi:hypothetical protein
MAFIAAKWIRQLQVVQINPSYLELYVVPVRPPSDEEIRAIKKAIKKVLWNVATLEVVIVPEIPTTYDTKFRVHRSLIDQEQ